MLWSRAQIRMIYRIYVFREIHEKAWKNRQKWPFFDSPLDTHEMAKTLNSRPESLGAFFGNRFFRLFGTFGGWVIFRVFWRFFDVEIYVLFHSLSLFFCARLIWISCSSLMFFMCFSCVFHMNFMCESVSSPEYFVKFLTRAEFMQVIACVNRISSA